MAAPRKPSEAAAASTAAPVANAQDPAAVVRDDARAVVLPGTSSLGDAAAAMGAPVVPVPAGGPGVGADRIATASLGTEVRALDPRTADPRGPVAGDPRFMPPGGFPGAVPSRLGGPASFDPDLVPGTHLFAPLTTIERDGRTYWPGGEDKVELDFRGYEELVSIGAVAPIDWATGEPLRIAPGPGAPRF